MTRTAVTLVGASLIAGLDGARALAARLPARPTRCCRTAHDLAVLLGLAVWLRLAAAADELGSP